METHPALGEVIVAKVPYLEDTLSGVRHHHERWDGKGYPDGLAGESISRLARLLALADTYDAMTGDRPYRKGLSIETALSEIAKNAGVQFDPVLADQFVRYMTQQTTGVEAAA
jgi:HD-GYP domain-containing protein (c-di-GMP phosphodiesterase class II)